MPSFGLFKCTSEGKQVNCLYRYYVRKWDYTVRWLAEIIAVDLLARLIIPDILLAGLMIPGILLASLITPEVHVH